MSEIIGQVLMEVILPGLGAVLMVAAIALVRAYMQQMKSEQQRQTVLSLVKAAEQLYGGGKELAKRRFVRERMKLQGIEELQREKLEAAVYDISCKQAGGGPRP